MYCVKPDHKTHYQTINTCAGLFAKREAIDTTTESDINRGLLEPPRDE